MLTYRQDEERLSASRVDPLRRLAAVLSSRYSGAPGPPRHLVVPVFVALVFLRMAPFQCFLVRSNLR